MEDADAECKQLRPVSPMSIMCLRRSKESAPPISSGQYSGADQHYVATSLAPNHQPSIRISKTVCTLYRAAMDTNTRERHVDP